MTLVSNIIDTVEAGHLCRVSPIHHPHWLWRLFGASYSYTVTYHRDDEPEPETLTFTDARQASLSRNNLEQALSERGYHILPDGHIDPLVHSRYVPPLTSPRRRLADTQIHRTASVVPSRSSRLSASDPATDITNPLTPLSPWNPMFQSGHTDDAPMRHDHRYETGHHGHHGHSHAHDTAPEAASDAGSSSAASSD